MSPLIEEKNNNMRDEVDQNVKEKKVFLSNLTIL